MGILRIIGRNMRGGPRTRRPNDLAPIPEGFRGTLTHDETRCTGCADCMYVCSPGAIAIVANEQGKMWNYYAGQCTFCARCVDCCPTKAISLERIPPVVTGEEEQQRISHFVPYRACTRCGRKIIPLPDAVLEQWYEGELPASVSAEQHLCEDCRRKVTSQHLRDGILGTKIDGR